MSLHRYSGSFFWPVVFVIGFSFLTVFMILWLVFANAAIAADNNPPCLTKEQARAKWPKEIIYWRTIHRCWGITPPGRRIPHTVVAARMITQEEIDELQTRHEAERRLRTCCWPPLPVFEVWQERIQGLVNDK